MASKLLSFLFILSLFSLQIYARDVQFFSKVSPSAVTTAGATPVKPENFNNPKQEQDPSFMQETQNAYGLYGNQETTETQFPTTTKLAGDTTFATTQAQTREPYYSNSNTNYNNEQFSDNAYGEQNKNSDSKYNYYSNNGGETQFPTTTKLAGDNSFTTTLTRTREPFSNYPNSNTNYNNEQFSDNAYGEQNNNFQESNYRAQNSDSKYHFYGNNGGNGNKNGYKNVERQGMSDTRFMENGKYYYDVQNENNYFPDQYQQNSRSNYNNNYDTRGYKNEKNFEFENSSMENFENDRDFPENEEYKP